MELLHPYRDTRGHCGVRGPLEADRLFELLTSETEATLRGFLDPESTERVRGRLT